MASKILQKKSDVKKKNLLLTYSENFITSVIFVCISAPSPSGFASLVMEVKAEDEHQLEQNHYHPFSEFQSYTYSCANDLAGTGTTSKLKASRLIA